jgi:signal transduction histidine kinase
VLTGFSYEQIGTKAVKSGAQDFLMKGQLSAPILKRSLLYAIERSRAQKMAQSKIIEGQERERKRIAEELHDGIGQLLSAINLNLKGLEPKIKELNKKHRKSYQNTLTLLEQAVEEVRNISRNIRPGVLEKFGLVKGLERLAEDMDQTSNLNVYFYHNDIDQRFSDKIEVTLYRVAQELLNNAVKHAQAEEIQVQLIKHENELVLMVEDDGVGFDSELAVSGKGIGLQNIETRVKSMDGQLNLDTSKEKGTSVTVHLPLKES